MDADLSQDSIVGRGEELNDFSISQEIPTEVKWELSKKFLPSNKVKTELSVKEPQKSKGVQNQFQRLKNPVSIIENRSASKYKISRKSHIQAQEPAKDKTRKFLSWLVPSRTNLRTSKNNLGNIEEKNYENLTEYQLNVIGDKSHSISVNENQGKSKSKATLSTKHLADEFFRRNLENFEKRMKKVGVLKHFPVIHPEGRLKLVWNIFICLCILFQFFVITIELFFDVNWHSIDRNINITNFYISQVLKYMILLDIILSVFTGYFFQGNMIMDPYKIIKNYIKKLFLIDLLVIIPIFFEFTDNDDELEHTSAFYASKTSFIKLLFVFRLIKLKRTFYYIELILSNNEKIEGILALFKLSFKILFTAHLLACMWYFIGDFSKRNNKANWMTKAFENSLVNFDWRTFYLYSLYWSITTMITVGYGDITPTNPMEIGFVICSMIIGCGLFGYSLSNIGIIFEKFFSQENEIRTKLRVINRYMKRKEIDFDLQGKVRRYLNYILKESERENSEKELELINKLSISLKKELLLQANGKILLNCDFFKNNFSLKTIQKLSELIAPIDLAPQDYVFEEGNLKCDNLYLVSKGKVELFSYCDNPNKDSFLKIKSLEVGDIFGEYSFITSKPREYSAISVGYTKVFSLSKSKFLEVLHEEHSEFESYCKIRDMLVLYNDCSSLMNQCFSCGSLKHTILSCPILHYIPSKDLIFYRLNKKKGANERRPYLRHMNRATHPLKTMAPLLMAKNKLGEDYDLDEYQDFIEKLKEECLSLGNCNFQIFPSNDDLEPQKPSRHQEGASAVESNHPNKGGLDERYLSIKSNVNSESEHSSSPLKISSIQIKPGTLRIPTNNYDKDQPITHIGGGAGRLTQIEQNAVSETSPRAEKRKRSFWDQSSSRHSSLISSFKSKSLRTNLFQNDLEEYKDPESSGQGSNNQHTKYLNQTNQPVKEGGTVNLFDYTFDVGKNFKRYFPHNNPHFVIEKFKKRLTVLGDSLGATSQKKSDRGSIFMGQAPLNLRKRESKLARMESEFK